MSKAAKVDHRGSIAGLTHFAESGNRLGTPLIGRSCATKPCKSNHTPHVEYLEEHMGPLAVGTRNTTGWLRRSCLDVDSKPSFLLCLDSAMGASCNKLPVEAEPARPAWRVLRPAAPARGSAPCDAERPMEAMPRSKCMAEGWRFVGVSQESMAWTSAPRAS